MTQLWRAEFDKLPPEVNKYLLPQELDQRVISTRKHQAVLLWPLFFALAGLVIALILSGTILRGQGGLLTVVWVIWVLLALHLIWATVNWFIDYFVVTSHRMMLTSGLLTRKVDEYEGQHG